MATWNPRLASMPTQATRTSRESLDFLQHRVSLFGLVMGGLSAAFLVFSIVFSVLGGSPQQVTQPSTGFHALAVVFLLGIWWACRRGKRSARAIMLIEGVGMVGACTAYLLMGAFIPPIVRPDLILILVLSFALFARAVFVPGHMRDTVRVGMAIGIPLLAVTWWIFDHAPPTLTASYLQALGREVSMPLATFAVITAAAWWTVATCLAAAASQVIYGLRTEVKDAQRLGQYLLQEKLGEGGMGVVYRARHAMLRRPTAIKLLSHAHGGSAALERFEREVQLTAGLTHQNTVRIYDYGRTPEGVFYYAMELIEGVTLKELVEATGPLEAPRVLHVLHQVAGALSEAHEAGLVHRDVKPANIMLCSRGGVADVAKVLDFGLVKDLADEGSIALTNASAVLGTPDFLAPEVMSDPDRVDARCDLYGLGVTAWYLLVGEPPFQGATAMEVCSHHLHSRPDAPSARSSRPIPSDLEEIVLACLAKRPEDRPASARALKSLLASCAAFGEWTEERSLALQVDELAAVERFRQNVRGHDPDRTTRALDRERSGATRLTVEIDSQRG